ncbi:MAG: D-glycero-D-manno-heptose 1 7-bisphosphate [Planctomycetota bacterium]|nr:MAG: D-glycero-D-manno-heptose 1 7-bisphosphate [Planctomycetota bacterium]
MPCRAVFLDRDGVLCEDRADYVKSWAEWRWVAGTLEGAAALARAGRRLVVITNQACVGKGIVPRTTLDEIHARMEADFAAAGAPLAGVYVCPHTEADACDCRKPKPGLLLAAARDLDLDLAASAFVGDNLRDREAALASGVGRFVLVLTGQGTRWAGEARARGLEVPAAPDLRAAAEMILKQ